MASAGLAAAYTKYTPNENKQREVPVGYTYSYMVFVLVL
jgi:hypothetical protein